jgi:hypothetical protein
MYETEAMKELADQAGLTNTVVINTCAVTAEAVRKAKQDIRKLRRQNPEAKLIVTGCAAQTEPDTFIQMTEVDVVIGNTEKMQPSIWAGLAGDFGTEPIQVDDIMSVTEPPVIYLMALAPAAEPMSKYKTAVIIVAPFVSFHSDVEIPARYPLVSWWIKSSA